MKNTWQAQYSRFFFLRSAIDRLLTMSSLFSCALVMARVSYTKRLTFIFLIWNLILAFLPWCITKKLTEKPQWVKNKGSFLVCFIVWIALIPNSFYILTDLYHLGDGYNDYLLPNWYDLAMILSLPGMG